MSDLFDEFMRELQRRRAQAEGRTAGDSTDGDGTAAGETRRRRPPPDATPPMRPITTPLR